MFNGIPDFHQSVEMMKNMWSSAAKGNTDPSTPSFGLPGMSPLNPFGIPKVDLEELDKRIKDLKSVEAWLSLNLNVLQTTIQGLEVQKATLSALQDIAQTMQAAKKSPESPEQSSQPKDQPPPTTDGAKLAQDLMEQMSKSMSNMMSAFPSMEKVTTQVVKKPAVKKTTRKSTAAKTTKPRSRRSAA
jgi:hypothetical protein